MAAGSAGCSIGDAIFMEAVQELANIVAASSAAAAEAQAEDTACKNRYRIPVLFACLLASIGKGSCSAARLCLAA
eukprot:3143816-Alexandrium_andersonii.AAC.1